MNLRVFFLSFRATGEDMEDCIPNARKWQAIVHNIKTHLDRQIDKSIV